VGNLRVGGPADAAAALVARRSLTHDHVRRAARLVRVCLVEESERRAERGVGEAVSLARARAVQESLFRCLLGDPTRPVNLRPEWLAWNGGFVARMAEAIYEERRFAELPVLADALEDAGCDDEALLAHCREGGPHARGCWAVDAVLGRQ
jgi:hypothetical protein